jgi:hypothetical protein
MRGIVPAKDSWKDLTPARHLGVHGKSSAWQIDQQLYVFELDGHVTSDVMYGLFQACWQSPGFEKPYGVIGMVSGDLTYDPDLREFSDRAGLVSAAAVGLVVERVLARMVLSAVGLATRLKHGTDLSSHATFIEAHDAVRAVLAKAVSRR